MVEKPTDFPYLKRVHVGLFSWRLFLFPPVPSDAITAGSHLDDEGRGENRKKRWRATDHKLNHELHHDATAAGLRIPLDGGCIDDDVKDREFEEVNLEEADAATNWRSAPSR